MLVSLMYTSRAVDFNPDSIDAILPHSREKNTARGITGVLCYGRDSYLQALEGGRDAVSALYNKILVDPRHTDVVLLRYEEIEVRRFVSWTMGQVNLSTVQQSILLKYSEMPELDAHALSGTRALALLNELVATAAIATRN